MEKARNGGKSRSKGGSTYEQRQYRGRTRPLTRLGYIVSGEELQRRGFQRLDIEFVGEEQQLASGACRNWNSVGEVPASPGLYAFVVEKDQEMRAVYVGRTANLWMVTKGTLPGGHSRPGQRYGRPKYAGVTRERINALVVQAAADGYTVSHWRIRASTVIGVGIRSHGL